MACHFQDEDTKEKREPRWFLSCRSPGHRQTCADHAWWYPRRQLSSPSPTCHFRVQLSSLQLEKDFEKNSKNRRQEVTTCLVHQVCRNALFILTSYGCKRSWWMDSSARWMEENRNWKVGGSLGLIRFVTFLNWMNKYRIMLKNKTKLILFFWWKMAKVFAQPKGIASWWGELLTWLSAPSHFSLYPPSYFSLSGRKTATYLSLTIRKRGGQRGGGEWRRVEESAPAGSPPGPHTQKRRRVGQSGSHVHLGS